MNHNEEEDPDFLGGLGDMLPADVLKEVNELLAHLHRHDQVHHGSTVFVYAPGSQYIDTQVNVGEKTHPGPPCVGREKESSILSEVLATDEALALWKKVQDAGYVDDAYQPKISRSQSALLADAMARRLDIKDKWKVFETLWNRKNMYRDYYKALNLQQSLEFQDEIKRLFR